MQNCENCENEKLLLAPIHYLGKQSSRRRATIYVAVITPSVLCLRHCYSINGYAMRMNSTASHECQENESDVYEILVFDMLCYAVFPAS